jgi:hypothetical protein
MSCKIQLERIVDRQIRKLHSKEIASVKEIATRELEKMIRNKYSYFFHQASKFSN